MGAAIYNCGYHILNLFLPILLNLQCVVLMDAPANLQIYKGFCLRSVFKVYVFLACKYSLKLLVLGFNMAQILYLASAAEIERFLIA